MDQGRFDSLARSLATATTRRGVLRSLAALGAGLLGARAARAQQVTQASCGNVVCNGNGCACKPGCVCCVYGNGNSRCRPPQECAGSGGAAVACPPPTTTTTQAPTTTTTTTTTVPPTTTSTTTTAVPPVCGEGFGTCPGSCVCVPRGSQVTGPLYYCITGAGTFASCPTPDFPCPSGEVCTAGSYCRTACPAAT